MLDGAAVCQEQDYGSEEPDKGESKTATRWDRH
jgi:hypothetical protein